MAKRPIPGGLGRIHSFDPRDSLYPFPFPIPTPPSPTPIPAPPAPTTTVVSKIWDFNHAALDQGKTPMCVGYGTAAWLVAAPIVNPLPDPVKLYYAAQKYDGFVGPHDGTTVRAAMKLLKAKGVISAYYWSTDIETIKVYVLEKGPVIVGTDWLNNMFYPDSNGNLSVSGSYAGGHCYVLLGADKNHRNRSGANGAFQILNSWGSRWGLNGRAWISFTSMKNLIARNGECAVATEVLEKTPVIF